MSDFVTSTSGIGPLDPHKRVAYPLGMVLGSEDFLQEQHHLRARDDVSVRALHGYGTVAGLGLSFTDGLLQVAPGLAVDPEGRLVCVGVAQCADLGAWIAANADDLAGSIPDDSPPDTVEVYVLLCHAECATDSVPLPSETCRSAADSAAPSRVLDAFELRLTLSPPVEGGEIAGTALEEAVEALVGLAESPPEGFDIEALQQELTDWVTTNRPEVPDNTCLDGPAPNCGQSPVTASSGVLLGVVEIDLNGDLTLDGPPRPTHRGRPVLLSSRFLQEWLLRLTLRPGGEDHNALNNLATGDVHTQYLPVDGSRPMSGELDMGGNRLVNLARSGADDSAAMRRDQIVGFDLQPRPGVAPGARIASLQGTPVVASGASAPTVNEVLTFDGNQWTPRLVPQQPAPGPAEIGQVLPFATVRYVGTTDNFDVSTFMLWFAVDPVVGGELGDTPLDDRPQVRNVAGGEQLLVYAERCGRAGLQLLRVDDLRVRQVQCNLYRVDLQSFDPLLRFVFRLPAIEIDGQPATDYAADRRIAWQGQDGEETVTKWVTNPTLEVPVPGFDDLTQLVPASGGRIVIER